ncbi:hypothetical protein [Candidatus Spongiihabitans sp.]
MSRKQWMAFNFEIGFLLKMKISFIKASNKSFQPTANASAEFKR